MLTLSLTLKQDKIPKGTWSIRSLKNHMLKERNALSEKITLTRKN